MSKLTYLQIVQRVAAAIDTDNVTTIDESPESEQIALLVQTVYSDLISDFPWYHKREIVNLEATETAHILRIPADVDQLLSDVIYYDNEPVYFWQPSVMQSYLARQDRTRADIDDSGALNNRDPKYWSSYDDVNIIFDSYNGTLTPSLTSIWVSKQPDPPAEDTDVPDLPHDLHVALLYGVLEEAFRTLKGDEVAAGKYERKYLKARMKAKRWARQINKQDDIQRRINYGRKNTMATRKEISSHFVTGG